MFFMIRTCVIMFVPRLRMSSYVLLLACFVKLLAIYMLFSVSLNSSFKSIVRRHSRNLQKVQVLEVTIQARTDAVPFPFMCR